MAFYCFFLLNFIVASYGTPKEFVCVYTKHPVRIDGRLGEWKNANVIKIEDERGRTDNTARIYAMWDNRNLYLAFDVVDENLEAKQSEQDHPELFLDDMVEFLIDPLNNKDSCWAEDDIIYHINLLGKKKDDKGSADCLTNPRWNGNAKYSIAMDGSFNTPGNIDRGYIVEISIPWKEMKIKPIPGQLIGANFAVGDNGKLFDWVNASPFRSPYAFGNLVLSKGEKW